MPQMQLSTEVLPAPLGPIRHSSSPGRVSRDTSWSTWRPPKARPMPSRRSEALSAGDSAIPAPAAAVLLDVAIAALPVRAEPQVELADVRVVAQHFRRAGEHDPAVLEHVGAVGDIEGDRRVLL